MTQARILAIHGIARSLPEWARLSGIKSSTIRARIDAWGWSIEEAVGLVPHVSLRGKCRGKPVTIRYKKKVDRDSKIDNTKHMEAKLWNIWR